VSKFGNIFLSWRKGKGFPRHIVGVIKNNTHNEAVFHYFPSEKLRFSKIDGKLTKLEKEKLAQEVEKLRLAKEDGFDKYTEFQDLEKVYSDGVLDIFKQRLFKSERTDYKDFLAFWGINEKYKDDTMYMLAHTHGMVPTDNFEFLADFHANKETYFVSEITGLSHIQPKVNIVGIGDNLKWKKNASKKDPFQVDVFTKEGVQLGWLKKIHSKIFYKKNGDNLKIRVKALDKNGTLKRAFVEVYA
jgi:hypothetical protein